MKAMRGIWHAGLAAAMAASLLLAAPAGAYTVYVTNLGPATAHHRKGAFSRAAVSSEIAPGAVSTPPGLEPFPKKLELFYSMFRPISAACPAANSGDTPTSGWNRQFIRSWMISLAGTATSSRTPDRLSDDRL